MLAIALSACGGGDGIAGGDDDSRGADAAQGDDPLSCVAFCELQERCNGADDNCVSDCLRAPDLPTDACEAAYATRNACVAELSCAELMQWEMPEGTLGPCWEESADITDACGS